MKRLLPLLLLLLLAAPLRAQEDPWLWLEGVEDPKALEWVRARNDESLPRLTGDPRYPAVEAELRAILLAEDRIPRPALRGGWVFNFWQDKDHVRGLWRRVPLERYGDAEPPWEVLLDLDALAEREGENRRYLYRSPRVSCGPAAPGGDVSPAKLSLT